MALEQFLDAQNLMKHVADVQVSTPLHSQQIANFSCDSRTASDSAAHLHGPNSPDVDGSARFIPDDTFGRMSSS
jgi:hypothetical protein